MISPSDMEVEICNKLYPEYDTPRSPRTHPVARFIKSPAKTLNARDKDSVFMTCALALWNCLGSANLDLVKHVQCSCMFYSRLRIEVRGLYCRG
jgi:hypothetical protein